MQSLQLTVTDYTDAHHWYWRLTDATGSNFLSDNEVKLNPTDREYAGFLDLSSFLYHNASADRRHEDETRLVREVGDWIGRRVFGAIGEKILAAGTPSTVRVIIPDTVAASGLLYRPWEAATIGGKPLALQDVSLVFEVAGEKPPVKHAPVKDRLRILAVYSLPTGASALNLRHERYQLEQLIRRIASNRKLAIDLRVLQYGVTRDKLRDLLSEGEGWDIIHFSGHGLEAHLLLETDAGQEDRVTSKDLVALLKPARGRLKWVTLSACLSAAATIEETLRWLGIEPRRTKQEQDAAQEQAKPEELPALARLLVKELDCAVLGMRYPVGDSFAIHLADQLYDGVIGKKNTLARALQLAMPAAALPTQLALSMATPALFGRAAAELTISAPKATRFDTSAVEKGLARFPRPGRYFVGRVGPMSNASAALASQSEYRGVLFHGMAGAGKTSCAVELAWRFENLDRFSRFLWYKAPEKREEADGALAAFAVAWEAALGDDFAFIHAVNASAGEFDDHLLNLKQFFEVNAILIVLDNLESLLRDNGAWRDEKWGKLIAALATHEGESRCVLTSRIRLQQQGGPLLLRELPIHSLSRDETLLLARQRTNLGKLVESAATRKLVFDTLEIVQGHPKLLDLAERQAADPENLRRQVDRARAAFAEGKAELGAFFGEGKSSIEPEDFLRTLAQWTEAITAQLPEPARRFFLFLCGLEEEDREKGVVEPAWPRFCDGRAPAFEAVLSPLVEVALVDVTDAGRYAIHPGVGEAGRALAGEAHQSKVDELMGAFWAGLLRAALHQEGEGTGRMIVRAGLRAAPYLMRREEWNAASVALQQAMSRDSSPGTLAAALPNLRRIAETTGRPDHAGLLATALRIAGLAQEAGALLKSITARAEAASDWRTASLASSELATLLMERDPEEALLWADRAAESTRLAGLGPWTQLSRKVERLQILNQLGRYAEVLSEVQAARVQFPTAPDSTTSSEAATPWNVREVLLDTGHTAAAGLKDWPTALALNRECVKTTAARGATALEISRTQFNDYHPLLRLRQFAEARMLLHECRRTYEAHSAVKELGGVYSALADLEDELGSLPQAIKFEETALRYSYQIPNPSNWAISHFNLANYLLKSGRADSFPHRLTAGVIQRQTSDGRFNITLEALSRHVTEPKTHIPNSFDELCSVIAQVDGVRLREMFDLLPKTRAKTGDEAMQQVLELARNHRPPAP